MATTMDNSDDDDELQSQEAMNVLGKGLGAMMGGLVESVGPALTNMAGDLMQAQGNYIDHGIQMQAQGNYINPGIQMQAQGNPFNPGLRRQAQGNIIPDQPVLTQDDSFLDDLIDQVSDMNESFTGMDSDIPEELDALGNAEKLTEDTVAGKKKMSKQDFPTIHYYHNVCGCDPLNWNRLIEENSPNFQKNSLESINFADYGYLTDATVFAWNAAGFQFASETQSEKKPSLFLSYEEDNRGAVKALYRRLFSKGYRCWMDVYSLYDKGSDRFENIKTAITESDIFVSCLSSKYTASAECGKEVTVADSLKKPIVPLLLERVEYPLTGAMAPLSEIPPVDCDDKVLQFTWKKAQFDSVIERLGDVAPVAEAVEGKARKKARGKSAEKQKKKRDKASVVFLDLARNRYLSDAGIGLLAQLLQSVRNGAAKITLDGCERVTEHGLKALCEKVDLALDISANSTSLSSQPKLVLKKAGLTTKRCPVLRTANVEDCSSAYGCYCNVYICPQQDVKLSLAEYLVNGSNKGHKGPAYYGDIACRAVGDPGLPAAILNTKLKLNVSELLLKDPSSTLLFGACAHNLIVPFSTADIAKAKSHIVTTLSHFLLHSAPFSGIKAWPHIYLVGVDAEKKCENWENDWVQNLTNLLMSLYEEVQKKWEKQLAGICSNSERLSTFTDHMVVSSVVSAGMKIDDLLQSFTEHFTFIHFAQDTTKADLLESISRHMTQSMSDQPEVHFYEDTAIFDTILGMRDEKIVTKDQILKVCADQVESANFIEQHLKILHNWGKILYLEESKPAVVVTNVSWFTDVLQKLQQPPGHTATDSLPCLNENTRLFKESDILEVIEPSIPAKKMQLVLNVLLSYKQLLLIHPDHSITKDTKYFLLPPRNLEKPTDKNLWEKFSKKVPNKRKDLVEVHRKFEVVQGIGGANITAWYSVLGEVLRFCRPLVLHDTGMAWHQGAVEMLLQAQIADHVVTSIELTGKSFALPDAQHGVHVHLDHVFSIYEDAVAYALHTWGMLMCPEPHKSYTGPRSAVSECTKHVWEHPLPAVEKGEVDHSAQTKVTVCTLCGNCSAKGSSCEFSGVDGDHYLQCACDTTQTCCWNCGICRHCAEQLWTYRSYLRPNMNCAQSFIKEGLGKDVMEPNPAKCVVTMDTALLNKADLYLMLADQTMQQYWALEGDHHDITLLERRMYSEDPDTRYTLTLEDLPGQTPSNIPKFNFSTCRNVTAWPNGEVRFSPKSITDKSNLENISQGKIVSKHPLTSDCFYFEIEIVKKSEVGALVVGVTNIDGGHESSSLGVTLRDERYANPHTKAIQGSLSNLRYADRQSANIDDVSNVHIIGFGITLDKSAPKNTLFYSINGRDPTPIYTDSRQIVTIDRDRHYHAMVRFDGGDWTVNLRTPHVWRCEEHTNSDGTNSLWKRTDLQSTVFERTDWGNIEGSPVEVKPSQSLIFQDDEDFLHTTIEVRLPEEVKKPWLFKVKLTNPKDYTAKPNSGVLTAGESMSVEIKARPGLKPEQLSKAKFRLEVVVDQKELGRKRFGTEYSPYTEYSVRVPGAGSRSSEFDSAKVSAAWEENVRMGAKTHNITFTTKIVQGDNKYDYRKYVSMMYERYISGDKIKGKLRKMSKDVFEQKEITLDNAKGSGLGCQISGGTDNARRGTSSIYVSKLSVGGLARRDGRLRVYDIITSINGVTTTGMTKLQAAEALKKAGDVKLTIQRVKSSARHLVSAIPHDELNQMTFVEWQAQTQQDGVLLHEPHPDEEYILARLSMDGLPVFEALIPRDNYRLIVEGFNDPPHVPRLKSLSLVQKMKDSFNKTVMPYYHENDMMKMVHCPRMPKTQAAAQLEVGHIVYIPWTTEQDSFCKNNGISASTMRRLILKRTQDKPLLFDAKKKKKAQKVKFSFDDSPAEEQSDAKNREDINNIKLYIPARILKILEEGTKLLVEWHPTIESHLKHQIGTSVVAKKDAHSVYWAYNLSIVGRYEPTEVDLNSVVVKRWVHVGHLENYTWDVTHKSKSMTVDGSKATRGFVAASTDGVRGSKGFDSGIHTFKITCKSDGGWGSYGQIGICTADAAMHINSYNILIGKDSNSYGWNIPTKSLMHNGARTGLTPLRSDLSVYMEINLQNRYVRYFFDDDKEGFKAFTGLPAGKMYYPCVGVVFGGAVLSIKYVNADQGLSDSDTEGSGDIYVCELDPNLHLGQHAYLPQTGLGDAMNGLSGNLSAEHKRTLGAFALTGNPEACDSLPVSATVQKRQLRSRCNPDVLDLANDVPPSLFIFLPRALCSPFIVHPDLAGLTDLASMNIHTVCFEDCYLMDVMSSFVHSEFDHDRSLTRQVMHLLDEPGHECPVDAKALLQLAVFPYIMMATSKFYLPSFDRLLDRKTTVAKQHLESGLHKALVMYASLVALNFDWDPFHLFDEDGEHMFENLMSCLPVDIAEKARMSKLCLCDSHAWALHLGRETGQETVLNLSRAKPYSDCLTSVFLDATLAPLLQQIPQSFVETLPNLKTLRIYGREGQLEKIPTSFGGFKRLRYLDMTNTRFTSLPGDLGKCSELQHLIASENLLEELPPMLGDAENLQTLRVGINRLRHLPERLEKLTKLRELNAAENMIWKIPSEFSYLVSLTDLNLKGCSFRIPSLVAFSRRDTIVSALEERKHDLDRQITSWDAADILNDCRYKDDIDERVCAHLFYKIARIGHDFLPGDEDGGIPECIFDLENLTRLDLSYQAIRFVPKHIGKLKNLKWLNLESNLLLESLPGELGMLPHLTRLKVSNCPSLRTPPNEIVTRGVVAMKAYLRRLFGGTTENWRTKLMCVGLGGAGKTSLLKALMSPKNQTAGTSDDEVTDGIDIKTWSCMSEQGHTITYNTWDFAGQDIYYNTHQFFLSGRAVYLLLWTCRLGYQHAGLDFWLSSIQCHAPKAPIFVIGTNCDIVPKAEIPSDAFLKKYPQIKGFFMVSSTKGTNIAQLKAAILRETTKEHYMGESVPTVYLNFEQEIISMRKTKSVVPFTDIQDKAIQCGIYEQKDIERALVFLHDLGTIQFFDNEFLRDNVVINPQWIVNVMACVVSIKNSPIVAGRFYHERDKAVVWKDFPESLHDWLLRLTEEFDLTFPMSPSLNLVPCLLPQQVPEFEWPALKVPNKESVMLYRFGYLPAGLFNRSQVRLFQYSDTEVIWKNGSVLRKNEHLALIREVNNKELVVKVQGPRPENILFLIHEVIESLIAEFFYGVTYDFLLPCPDCLKGGGIPSENGLFEATLVRKARDLNTPFLQCREFFHTVSMSALQGSMPPESSTEFDIHLAQSMTALDDLRSDLSTDLFIVICDADLKALESAHHVHPKTIIQYLKSQKYKCWFKESSSKTSMHDTTIALQDSKLMLAFLSESFVEDKECVDLFLHAKNVMNKDWQVVGVGENLNWRDTSVGAMEIGSSHRYVNLTQKERYNAKIEELGQLIKMKLDSTKRKNTGESPLCFISYAWANSHRAVRKGSRTEAGALGWEQSDPRALKDYLVKNGISCWIDIEQTGKFGLFEDIYHGIRDAEVVLICMSVQYARSKNCMMELRFAEVTLNKPIVAVLLGQGDDWKDTEMQALISRSKATVLNFQEEQENALADLLTAIKTAMPAVPRSRRDMAKKQSTLQLEDLKTVSFHEEFELAQRKFLRHLAVLADSDTMPYPRLFLLDFASSAGEVPAQESARPMSAMSTAGRERPGVKRHDTKQERSMSLAQGVDGYEDTWLHQPFCVRLLCEHDVGCHCSDTEIPLDELSNHEKEELLQKSATFLLRMYALMKHSGIKLNVNSHPEAKHFRTFLIHSVDELNMELSQSYAHLRNFVMEVDSKRSMTGLNRCYLVTGQIRWLCATHQKEQRVTVINDTARGPASAETVSDFDRGVKRLVDELKHLAEPYVKQRSDSAPRQLAPWQMDADVQEVELLNASIVKEYEDPEENDASSIQHPSTPDDAEESRPSTPSTNHSSGPSRQRPVPVKRRSTLLGGKDRPASEKTREKMKTSGQAVRSGNDQAVDSKACTLL